MVTCAAANCSAEPNPMDSASARRWIPFSFNRRQHQRQRRRDPEGESHQSNSVEGLGQIQEHNDLEMTLNDEQQNWLDVDLLRNDAANANAVAH